MKISKELDEMLKTQEGCLKVIALKLCEISESMKQQPKQELDRRSLFEMIFGK